MRECLTLFLHHRPPADPATAANLAAFRELEGEANVLPLDANSPEGWAGPDLAVRRWARSRDFVPARRYCLAEYDVRPRMALAEWWAPHWDADAACQWHHADPLHPADWRWWDHVGRLPESLRPHASGVSPFSFLLLSHRALMATAWGPEAPWVHCELRLGAQLKAAGMAVEAYGHARPGRIQLEPLAPADCTGPGIWHPVKA